MKKILLIVVGCLVLAGAGWGVYHFVLQKKLLVEDVLTQQPIFYGKITDLEKNLQEFIASPFGQAVQKINFKLLLDQSKMDSKQQEAIVKNIAALYDPNVQFIIKQLFSQEVALAAYSTDIDFSSLRAMSPAQRVEEVARIFENIVVVTRLKPSAQAIEVMSQVISQTGEDVTRDTQEYNKHSIDVITFKKANVDLYYTRLQDLLVFGVGSRKPVEKALDVVAKTIPSLSKDTAFQALKPYNVAGAMNVGYMDLVKIMTGVQQAAAEFVKTSVPEDQRSQAQRQLNETFEQFQGLTHLTYSYKGGPLAQGNLNLFSSSPTGEGLPGFACMPVENQTLRFIPKEIVGYNWNTCLRLNNYWGQWKQAQDEAQERQAAATTQGEKIPGEQTAETIEDFLGMSIEDDILPAIGDEFGGYLAGIKTGKMFPIPQLLLFLRVNDRAKVEAILTKMMGQDFLVMQQENYANVTINSAALPLGGDIQPSYCFLGDYLLVGINRQVLKDSLDVVADPALSLPEADDFKILNMAATGKNLHMVFLKPPLLIQQIKNLLETVNQWISAQEDQRAAFLSGSQRRLDDINKEIDFQQSEAKQFQTQATALADAIQALRSQTLDTTVQQQELTQLEGKIDQAHKAIEGHQEQRQQLEKIIGEYKQQMMPPEKRRLLLDEVLVP
ncbi:MAG: hypothetical protein Q7S13_06705, partial [Candidatus Omnitrophota bacterium]|nr:hypothetical protein [Candidatus Omnitrophota bacterium]